MANIFVDLVLNNRDFNRGMDQSQRKSQDFNKSLSRIGGVALTAAKAIGGVGLAVQGLAINQARLGAQLTDTADKIGVSTKFLQEFRFAAVQSGASVQAADMGLQRFTRRMAEAANGTGEARQTLREMGIAVRDTNGRVRDAESVLMDVADAFATSTNRSEMLAQAFKLFDSEGVVLINVLRNGSEAMRDFAREAERTGIILSEQESRTLKSLDDSYTLLRFSVKALADQFVLGLAEALKITNEEMIGMVANNKELARTLGEGVGEAFRTLADFSVLLANNIDLVRNALLTLIGMKTAATFQSITKRIGNATTGAKTFSGFIGGATKALKGMLVPLAPLVAKMALFVAITTGITMLLRKFSGATVEVGETTTTFGEIFEAVFHAAGVAVKVFVENAVNFFQTWKERITGFLTGFYEDHKQTFQTITDFIRGIVNGWIALHVATINSIIDVFRALPRALISIFQTMLDLAKLNARSMIDIFKAIFTGDFEGVKDIVKNFGSEAGQLLTEGIAEPLGDIGNDIRQNFSDAFDRDFIGEAVGVIAAALNIAEAEAERLVLSLRRVKDETKDIKQDVDDATQNAAPQTNFDRFVEGWQDAGRLFLEETENFTKLGGEIFKQFSEGLTESITNFVMTGKLSMKGFLRDIFRMIVQSGIQRALTGIFGALGGGGGILGTLFGPFAGGKALGGMIPAGQFGLVGERGPEFIRGPAQITPIRQSDRMGSGPQQVTYNISAVDARSFRDLVAQDPEFIHAVASTGSRRLPR